MSQLTGLKLATPKYNLTLPSTGEALTMYPFKVNDEKNLLIASETGSHKNMIDAVKDVIENNIEGLNRDINELPSYEIEWLFLQMRSKSVGEISKLNLICEKCEGETIVNVNIEEVIYDIPENRENIIKIDDKFAIELIDPKIDDVVEAFGNDRNSVEQAISMMAKCTKTVYNNDDVIEVTELEIPDLEEIYSNFTNDQFAKIQGFFEKMPKLKKEVAFKCSSCGEENNQTLEGFQSFF